MGRKVAKQKHLVIQHLENISWEVLQEYPSVIQNMIRGKAGIYALYRKNKLYYVGLASNLMWRLKNHLKDKHKGLWDRFSVYLTIHDEHMKELESLILKITDPPGNSVKGGFGKSRNLRKDINRKIKEFDDDRRSLLIGGKQAEARRKRKLRNNKSVGSLIGLIERRFQLRGNYKNQKFRATLRKDGTIGFKSVKYLTPTAAAKAATGKKTVNGWNFWYFRNNKGQWVKLKEFRT